MKAPVSAVQQQSATNGVEPAATDILQEPYTAVGDALEKKAVYLQKRIERLKQYNLDAENGVQLNQEKEEARKKIDEVEKQFEYVQFLQKNVSSYQREFRKACKVRDAAAKKVVEAAPVAVDISEVLLYREILSQLARPSVRKFFETAANGAILLNKNELAEIDQLLSFFQPTMEHCKSLHDWSVKVNNAQAKVRDVILESDSIVVGEKTGKDAKELLVKIRDSAYFTANHFVKPKKTQTKERKASTKSSEENKQDEQPSEVVEIKTAPAKVQEVKPAESKPVKAAETVEEKQVVPVPSPAEPSATLEVTPAAPLPAPSETTVAAAAVADSAPVVESDNTKDEEVVAEDKAEDGANKDQDRRQDNRNGYRGNRDGNGYRSRNPRYGGQQRNGQRPYRPQFNGNGAPVNGEEAPQRAERPYVQNGNYQRPARPQNGYGFANTNGYYNNQSNGYGQNGYGDENGGYGGNRYRNGGGRQAPTTCGFVFASRH